MSQAAIEPVEQLRRLVNGYQVTQAIGVMVTLGLPDRLAAGPRSAAELASLTGADPSALSRLLRALVAIGAISGPAGRPGTFELTELGRLLCSDADESLAGWAAFVVRPYHWEAWGDLLQTVQTGENPFGTRHGGQSIWEWRQDHPDENAIFNRAMHALSAATARRLAATYDFSGFTVIADLGGGDGTLLAAVLAQHPGLRGVVFDLPHVVAGAPARLQAAGVADRVEVVEGSFFDGVPAGCDAYVLKSVLHDWDDEASVRILRQVRNVATPATTVLIVERTLDEHGHGSVAAMSDLNMLTMTGGAERTLTQWRALAGAGGFEITGTVDIGAEWSVIEAHATGIAASHEPGSEPWVTPKSSSSFRRRPTPGAPQSPRD